MFRLNEDACVDATRAGNMAHLLNHSCDPNCYSRTVTVFCEAAGAPVDHVIIYARRPVRAGEVRRTTWLLLNRPKRAAAACGTLLRRATIFVPAAIAHGSCAIPPYTHKPIQTAACARRS